MNKKRRGSFLVFFLLLGILVFSLEFVEAIKIDPLVMEKLENQSEVYVTVMLRDDSGINYEGTRHTIKERLPIYKQKKAYFMQVQENVLSTLSESEFMVDYKYSIMNAFGGYITRQGLEKLENNPIVTGIQGRRTLYLHLQDSVPLINATKVWPLKLNDVNITGAGQTVCVIDGGINWTHPDFGGCFGSSCRVLDGYDYYPPEDDNPMDHYGHGTHVAGIVGANGSIKGVAPGVKFVALKACSDTTDNCNNDAMAKAVNWCVDNASIYNISVITMSIGTTAVYDDPDCNPTLKEVIAINNAYDLGFFVDVASGNAGSTSGISSPACARGATSVGATYDANVGSKTYLVCSDATTYVDKITCFTNRNELLDLLAPGAVINSTCINGSYCSKSGISMAAPHVAGAAALLFQANPDLMPDEVTKILKDTGKPIYDNSTRLTFPRIDAYEAVKEALKWDMKRYIYDISACTDLSCNKTGGVLIKILNDNESFYSLNKSRLYRIQNRVINKNADTEKNLSAPIKDIGLDTSFIVLTDSNNIFDYNGSGVIDEDTGDGGSFSSGIVSWNPSSGLAMSDFDYGENANFSYILNPNEIEGEYWFNFSAIATTHNTTIRNFIYVGNHEPFVTLADPVDNYATAENNVSLACSAIDDWSLKNISLYHNITGTWQLNQSVDVTGTLNLSEFNLSNIAYNTTFVWNCLVCDTGDKCDWAPANRTVYITQCAYPRGDYDWDIDNIQYCNNTEIFMAKDKDLNILQGGSLTFENVKLWLNMSSNGGSVITVEQGGAMNITKASSINSTDSAKHYAFIVESGSIFSMTDSFLSEAGWDYRYVKERGLEINTTVTDFRNNTLINNYNGVTFYSNNNIIIGNTITDSSLVGIYLYYGSSNNTIINNTLNSNHHGIASLTNSSSNIIIGNTISSNYFGIYPSYGSKNALVNNTISSNYIGVYMLGGSFNNLTENQIWNCTNKCLYITSNNTYILGGMINKSEGYLVHIDGGDNNLFRDTGLFDSVNNTVHLNNLATNNTFLNVTYNISKESVQSGSQLIRKWYYRAYVNDSEGNNVSNANITAYNVSQNFAFSLMTNNDGYTPITEIIDYVNNGVRTYYSNYTINATKYTTSSHSYNASLGNELKDIFTLNIIFINNCSVLAQSNTIYVQEADINRNDLTGSCINITAQNITLDCWEYYIKSDDAYAGIYASKYNTTVKNCNITMSNSDGGIGIWLERANNSHVSENMFNNNYFGVYLLSLSNAEIKNNTLNSNYHTGIRFSNSRNNNITNNLVIGSTYGIVIYLNSMDNRFTDNTINSSGGYGVGILSPRNILENNNIWNCSSTAFSTTGCLHLGSDNNTVSTGRINSSSMNLIYLQDNSDNNLFRDIETGSAQNKVTYLTANSINNTFLNISYDVSKEYVSSGSQLIRKWYLDIYVNYTNGTAVDSANVSVYNRTFYTLDSDLTNSSGMTKRFEIAEYINNGGTRNYQTNLTINATKDLLYAERQLNLTRNYLDREFWLTII